MKGDLQIKGLLTEKRWCEYNSNSLLDKLRRNRKQIILCLAAAFIWGLAAHAYVFFHSSISHDSLFEFVADTDRNVWRIKLGRVFVPAYRILFRGAITAPWLIGFLSLLYIGITVFLVTKIFDIRSKTLIALISGVFATNITIISTAATYIHDLDADMMALLLAAFAVYLWKSFDKGFLYGIIPICLSLGFYQSYVSVAITLILLYLIMQLLNGYSADGKYRSFVQIMFFPFSHIYYMVLNSLVFALQILMISSSTASVYLPSAISRFRISLRAFIIIPCSYLSNAM